MVAAASFCFAMPDILLIAAHPHLAHSRVTRRLLARARALAAEVGSRVRVHDLYALYPDFFVDVAHEQQALAAASAVVWLHPIHWYSMPPLMKLWVDEVLAFGWAYGPGGAALKGKALWLVTSTGGGADSYQPGGHHHHSLDEFLYPYQQTARLTGMCWQPPLVLHSAHRADEAALATHEAAFEQQLRQGVNLLAADVVEMEEVSADQRPASPAGAD
jgi:glutathione-regulated potassium-efflux system ancillary protein KefF